MAQIILPIPMNIDVRNCVVDAVLLTEAPPYFRHDWTRAHEFKDLWNLSMTSKGMRKVVILRIYRSLWYLAPRDIPRLVRMLTRPDAQAYSRTLTVYLGGARLSWTNRFLGENMYPLVRAISQMDFLHTLDITISHGRLIRIADNFGRTKDTFLNIRTLRTTVCGILLASRCPAVTRLEIEHCEEGYHRDESEEAPYKLPRCCKRSLRVGAELPTLKELVILGENHFGDYLAIRGLARNIPHLTVKACLLLGLDESLKILVNDLPKFEKLESLTIALSTWFLIYPFDQEGDGEVIDRPSDGLYHARYMQEQTALYGRVFFNRCLLFKTFASESNGICGRGPHIIEAVRDMKGEVQELIWTNYGTRRDIIWGEEEDDFVTDRPEKKTMTNFEIDA